MATITGSLQDLEAVLDGSNSTYIPNIASITSQMQSYTESTWDGYYDLSYNGYYYSKSSTKWDVRGDEARLVAEGTGLGTTSGVITKLTYESNYIYDEGILWVATANIQRGFTGSITSMKLVDQTSGTKIVVTGKVSMVGGAMTKEVDSSVTYDDGNYLIQFGGNMGYSYETGERTGYVTSVSISSQGKSLLKASGLKIAAADVYGSDASMLVVAALSGNDKLTGTSADEQLYGYTGNDTIIAGAGDDVLAGGYGSDKLTGGTGADTFVVDYDDFDFTYPKKVVGDTITDFSVAAGDQIDLNSFGSVAIVSSKAEGVSNDAPLFYDSSSGKVYYDDAGESVYVVILTLTGKPKIMDGDGVFV